MTGWLQRSGPAFARMPSMRSNVPIVAQALTRFAQERNLPLPLPLSAFELSHHGSDKNLTRALLEKISCSRYLISTDGSTHRHPDHQALLRILRYSRHKPELIFNDAAATTQDWRTKNQDVLKQGFQNYETEFPQTPTEGVVVRFKPSR